MTVSFRKAILSAAIHARGQILVFGRNTLFRPRSQIKTPGTGLEVCTKMTVRIMDLCEGFSIVNVIE